MKERIIVLPIRQVHWLSPDQDNLPVKLAELGRLIEQDRAQARMSLGYPLLSAAPVAAQASHAAIAGSGAPLADGKAGPHGTGHGQSKLT